MHVGYVVKRFPRVSETFIAQEILELERRGVEVTVLALRPNDQPASHAWLQQIGAPTRPCHGLSLSQAWRRLHRRSRRDPCLRRTAEAAITDAFRFPSNRGKRCLCSATMIADEVATRQIDHLHAHFANQPAFVAHLASRLSGVGYSFTGHAKDLYADALPRALLRRLVEDAEFAVTVSHDNRRALCERLGPGVEDDIVTIYNGVSVPKSPPPRRERRDPRILCVARLVEKKGIDTLLHAMAAVDEGDGATLQVAGDGPLRQSLQATSRKLGVASRVDWLGTLAHEQVLDHMREAALFVLPCRLAADGDRDALPTVLLEAMSQGLPCVSTSIGGVPEIIEDGINGLLVRPDDPESLAGALTELLASKIVRRRMGRAGHHRAAHLFERRRNVAQLHELFEAAVADRPLRSDRTEGEVAR